MFQPSYGCVFSGKGGDYITEPPQGLRIALRLSYHRRKVLPLPMQKSMPVRDDARTNTWGKIFSRPLPAG